MKIKLRSILFFLLIIISLGIFSNSIYYTILGSISLIGLIAVILSVLENKPGITLGEFLFGKKKN